MCRRLFYRLNFFHKIRIVFLSICCFFSFMQYLSIRIIYWEKIPSPISSRLYPDVPITFNLQSYSVCPPEKLYIEKLTIDYHQYAKGETCFLIEHLDGGSWWSYVSHEFAEILVHLKMLGIQSNITYRLFSHSSVSPINLTRSFLETCQFDENVYRKNAILIVILLWDINRFLWHHMSNQWKEVFEVLHIRPMVFIDDLHYTKHESFLSRQYLFQHVTFEIFSTYAYLFHNYYHNISSSKITWLPHAASSSSIRSINQSAENLLFVSGANIFEWYPCRARAFFLCHSRKDLIACLEHPGYGETMKNDSSFFYGGERYFSYMKQYVFGLGTCQSVHYAIAKLFELPANGLVLVTTKDLIQILEKLNLYHNEHFLTIQCSSAHRLSREISDLQKVPKEIIDKIRVQSQTIVYERHMTEHRAKLLHVRLLAQVLLAIPSSDQQQRIWERWGRDC